MFAIRLCHHIDAQHTPESVRLKLRNASAASHKFLGKHDDRVVDITNSQCNRITDDPTVRFEERIEVVVEPA